ncbi:MAG: stage V sporulation protein AD [Clostridia bacterium]|nr:stage V sporulation protein AD [Clostridia bacterium]
MIIGSYSLVGKKEGEGNFGKYFDEILKDEKFGEKSFEKAERKIMERIVFKAIDKAQLNTDDIDMFLSGDLLNQIITSSFTARDFNTTFIGLYGACSTMAESLALASCLIDGGYFKTIACATCSHFSTAERQYRSPLELANQRPPISQWTVTGGGCTILAHKGSGNKITAATFGKVVDYGIKDVNNMGAAMAPAAMSTLLAHFNDTNTTPEDYDLIVTGDLGKLGSQILEDLMQKQGYNLAKNYRDCGQMIYKEEQKLYQGGSGCGCSASVLNSYIYSKLTDGTFKKVLFVATGALLSTLSSQQGESIPAIAHAVVIERGE